MKRSLLATVFAMLFIAMPAFTNEPPKGFESLFNGKDLTGWKSTGDMKVWGAENGVIYCDKGGGGWLLTDKEFGDFELRVEYKMPKGGNSGVAIRSPFKGDPAYSGMEIQLIDDEGWPGGLQKWQNTGAIYNVVPPKKINNKPIGEWNSIKIVAKGRQITVVNNGETLVDANLDDYVKEHGKKHPGILETNKKGRVGFQSYNKRVEFRNIYLKPLTAEKDKRLSAKPRDPYFGVDVPKGAQAYFPWDPPATKEAWEARKAVLKEQLLVSQGLWPMPDKTPLNAVVHGKIERDGYTVEKVFFASHPGHYVTGNLYRPTGVKGKMPVVLYTHGHWPDARLSTANTWASDKKTGAEATEESSKFFHQAGCAMLARLGCVVFHYDMVGDSDSKQIKHTEGFRDVEALLRLQSFMGLQTWNSIRAVDFVTSLPDVDATRVGITGASGGGTQSFILAAVDDRIAACFPAVMVSTAMQGGCICENSPYLRVGTTNIELAALIAPRPLGMTGANDWTKEIETKGLPELKKIYKMYGVEQNVMAKYLDFGHNYNQPSREVMYNFFNRHFKLGHEGTIREQPFKAIDPKQLSAYDDKHPLNKDATNAEGLKRYLSEMQQRQLDAMRPKDKASLAEFQKVQRSALRAMIADDLPFLKRIDKNLGEQKNDGVDLQRLTLSREGQGERLNCVVVRPKKLGEGAIVVWIHPTGISSLWDNGKLAPAAQAILDRNCYIFAIDPFSGRKVANTDMFFGYNRSLLAERVHDVLTSVGVLNRDNIIIHLVGFEEAGPWVLLARGLCGDRVSRTAADLNGFRFERVKDFDHEMMLPGALRYGGLPGLAATIAPHELYLHNAKSTGTGANSILQAAYRASGQPNRLQRHDEKKDAVAVVNWLLR
jgi:dienelactone hydrolase